MTLVDAFYVFTYLHIVWFFCADLLKPHYPVIGSGGQFAYASQYLFKGESVLLGRKRTIDKPLYVNCPFWQGKRILKLRNVD